MRAFTALMTFTAVMLWLTVLVGTYIIFPPYRAAPPSGMTDLSQFPRALVLANANTVWLHAFAMEIKEHMPWIASMLTTAVAELHFDDPFDIRTDEHSHTHSIWVAPEFIERYRM